MELKQDIVDEIVRRLAALAHVERIIIFGSAAEDRMTSDSDIDVLVLKHHIEDHWAEWQAAEDALRGLGIPVDIILMTTARFQETKEVIGGISYPADKKGRVVYEAA
jgi:uncharacterized protein